MSEIAIAQLIGAFLAGLVAGSVVSYAVAYYAYRKVLMKALNTLEIVDSMMDTIICNLKKEAEEKEDPDEVEEGKAMWEADCV